MRTFIAARPWIWSFGAATIVWLLIIGVAGGHGSFATLSVALQFATFFVIAGLGQTLVITAGPGNIDLSIPGVMTLAGYIAMGTMHGSNGHLLIGLAAGMGIGLLAGLVNVLLTQPLRIPPMIATLASDLIFQSIAIDYASSGEPQPSPLLYGFTAHRFFGLTGAMVLILLVTAVVSVALQRSRPGRTLLAVGQNQRAADLSGLNVPRTLALVYVASGLFAAAAGILLAAYSGGASLDMASDYLLMSIGVVVIGGTSIAGGDATPVGLWGAALLLGLVVTVLNLLHVREAIQMITTGLVIILVLALN